jgi:NADH-quinone oxidoreductase subunit J
MTRRLLLLLFTFGLATGSVALSADVAAAQPAQVDLRDGGNAAPEKYPHSDRAEGTGKGLAVLFWVFAFASLGGAVFVITRRNLVAAVMGMVGSFLGISAIYMMLYANFLAVVQMLVYAGAIMVLFVFVIMILNRPEDHPVGSGGRIGRVVGGAALLYLFVRLASLLLAVRPSDTATAAAAPGLTPQGHEWGSIKAVGTTLFSSYAFPFEAISILLLVAVVGAIAIARPLHEDASAEEGA